MNGKEAQSLINFVCEIVAGREDFRAAALCGSWARGHARDESDIDIIIIACAPNQLRCKQSWIMELPFERAGFRYVNHQTATYGAVWSAHIELQPSAELELSFAGKTWAALHPIDPGTRDVVADGFKILVDKDGSLGRLILATAN